LNYLIQNEFPDEGHWPRKISNLTRFYERAIEGIAKWTKAITNEYPNFNIVGEVWMQNQAQMAYWQKDSKIAAIQNYNSHLPSVMDFTLLGALGSVFNEDDGSATLRPAEHQGT